LTGVCYLDASACVKLVSPEPESDALVEYLRDRPEQVSSVVVDVEVSRAAARLGPIAEAGARLLLATITLVPMTADVRALARTIPPPVLRSLDAIHLATAVALGADLGVFVAYDQRLLDAAVDAGLPVASPG
jgi:predicted nucleic acid-binding protein